MTKMASMAINSKNLLKSSSPEPEDFWLILWQGQHRLPMHLNGGKLVKCHFMEGGRGELLGVWKWTKDLCLDFFVPVGLSAPASGIHTCI